MNIKRIMELTKAKCLVDSPDFDLDINYACSGDLMSDVLRFSQGNGLLVTGLANVHAVRTAEMSGITLIVFVCGKSPMSDVIEEAGRLGIWLLATELTMFETCGILYANGISEINSGKESGGSSCPC
jgi:hypothetical protein